MHEGNLSCIVQYIYKGLYQIYNRIRNYVSVLYVYVNEGWM